MLNNPFCRRPPIIRQPALDLSQNVRVVSVDVDRETLEVHPVLEAYDAVEEIQSCKELCGLEYMKKLLASGQVTAESLEDDSGTELDLTHVPDNVFEAQRRAAQANEEVAAAAKAAGCLEGEKYSAKQVEEMLTRAVKVAFEAQKAAAAPAESGGSK